MSLTWKDLAATLLVAGVGVVTYAKLHNFKWPLLGSWRTATLVLLVLGLGSCIAISLNALPDKNAWTTLATVLGAIAFGLAVLGIIINSKAIFLAVAADVVLLWVVTTLHHLLAKG